MLVVFVLYTTSITFFTHVHEVCGVPIVLSHFYDFWEDDTSEVGILKILVNCFRVSDAKGVQFPDLVDFSNHQTNTPLQEHHHSSPNQLLFYEMVSHFDEVILPILFLLIAPIIVYAQLIATHDIQCYVVSSFLMSYCLRGPPSSFLY